MKMPPKKRFITCEICGDRACRIHHEKRKFMAKFPLDETRCKQWVKAVGKEDLIYVPIEKLHELKFVCGNHFENKAFNKKKSRLKKFAVPSKNLKFDSLSDEMLLEFPCHIHSNIDVTIDSVFLEACDNEASLSQIEAIAGSSKSDTGKSERNKITPQGLEETRAQSEEGSSSSDEEGCNPALSNWIYASVNESLAGIGNVCTSDSLPMHDTGCGVSAENTQPSQSTAQDVLKLIVQPTQNTDDGKEPFQINDQVSDLRRASEIRGPFSLEEVRAESEEDSPSSDEGNTDYAKDCELSNVIEIDTGPETYIKCYTCLDESDEMKSMESVEQVACTIRRKPLQCHLSTLYTDVTGLPPPDPNLGAAMCVRCVIRLIDAYIFKLQSIESHAVIKTSAKRNNSQSSQISSTGEPASAINTTQKKDTKPSPKLELSVMNVVHIPAPETEQLTEQALDEENDPHECLDRPLPSLEQPQQPPKRAQKRKLPTLVSPDIGTDTTHVHRPPKKEEPFQTTTHETKQAHHYVDNWTSGLSTRIPCSNKPTKNVPIAVKLVYSSNRKKKPEQLLSNDKC